jgi:hypothetical protein
MRQTSDCCGSTTSIPVTLIAIQPIGASQKNAQAGICRALGWLLAGLFAVNAAGPGLLFRPHSFVLKPAKTQVITRPPASSDSGSDNIARALSASHSGTGAGSGT